jgi:hypothetical protein
VDNHGIPPHTRAAEETLVVVNLGVENMIASNPLLCEFGRDPQNAVEDSIVRLCSCEDYSRSPDTGFGAP